MEDIASNSLPVQSCSGQLNACMIEMAWSKSHDRAKEAQDGERAVVSSAPVRYTLSCRNTAKLPYLLRAGLA
jgi:hypothetical protein